MQDIYSEKDPLIGKVIGGKFKINRRIGSGGMSTVYQATQLNLGREIALKIINPNLVHDNESISRFYREAKDLASLSHPNIVTVFDFGTEDGFHYISMEYLQGKNLSEIIRREGRLDELKVVKYIAPIADALNHLHENGLIHRDIKSSNIFICSNERPVLMDFGIAFHQDKTISISGAILGTAEFMSPEQIRGEIIDGRSDIYSLGVVIYESITGRVPFYSDNPTSTLYKVVQEPPPPFPEAIKVSEVLKEVTLSAMEKDKTKRPPSGNAIYEMLNTILSPSESNRRKIQEEREDEEPKKEHKIQMPSQSEDSPEEINDQPSNSEDQFHVDEKITNNKVERSRSKVPFLIISILILIVAIGWYFNKKTKLPEVDTAQIMQQAKQAFDRNDFIMAHKYFLQVLNQEPNNLESRQMLTDCALKLSSLYINKSLVPISAGTFTMGNSEGDEDEKPQHQVSLGPFLIGKTEITNQQFVMFLNAFGCSGSGKISDINIIDFSKNRNINYENGIFRTRNGTENLPVIGVTWNGANLFCKSFLGRLPTEAEWEYSASGGQNFRYSGSDDINGIAWYRDNSSGHLNDVGTKKSNAFGLYDLSGNAWEWCNDFYDRAYYRRSIVQNPQGPNTGTTKVIRGGDFSCSRKSLSIKFRSNTNFAGSTGEAIGFRICFTGN